MPNARNMNITRSGCSAELKVKRVGVNKWRVTEFKKEHNHELNPENLHLFWSHRKKDCVPEKDLVEIVSRNAGHRKCAVIVDKENQRVMSMADTHAIHMHFMCMRSRDPAFTYAMDLDEENRVRNVFWVDALFKADYTHFGDVVMVDTTCLASKYKLPLVSFVGVNHHGNSILFGCALISDENTESFTWLFKAWLEAMSGQPPKALITDRNDSIIAAVAVVFPYTRHRFCLWHVLQSVSEKIGHLCSDKEKFMKKFHKCVFDSMSEDEFEKRWWKFILSFELASDEWLQCLYAVRRQWAPVYLKDAFFGGMSISERNECLSLFFGNHVNCQTNLKDFLEIYEVALNSVYEDIAREEIQSFHSVSEDRMPPSPFELQMESVYTQNIFKKFQEEVLGISSVFTSEVKRDSENAVFVVKAHELQDNNNKKVKERTYRVTWNSSTRRIQCVCRLFEFKGYLCRHALAVFLKSSILEIPHHYILKRWTKEANALHLLNAGSRVQGDHQKSVLERFDDICVLCTKLAHEASQSKKSYDVALRALQEALLNVVYENNNPRIVAEYCGPYGTDLQLVAQDNESRGPIAICSKSYGKNVASL